MPETGEVAVLAGGTQVGRVPPLAAVGEWPYVVDLGGGAGAAGEADLALAAVPLEDLGA